MQPTLAGAGTDFFKASADVVSTATHVVVTGYFRCDDLTGGTGLHGLVQIIWGDYANADYYQVFVNGSIGAIGLGEYISGSPEGTLSSSGGLLSDGDLCFFEATFARDGSYRRLKWTVGTATGSTTDATQFTDHTSDTCTRVDVGGWSEYHHFQGSMAGVSVYHATGDLSSATSSALHGGASPLRTDLAESPAHYWPLQGNGADSVGSVTLLAQGSATFTGGTEVAVARDLSGNEHHAIGWDQGVTQTTVGGVKAWEGDGASVLLATLTAFAHPFTLVTVGRVPALAALSAGALVALRTGAVSPNLLLYFTDSGPGSTYAARYTEDGVDNDYHATGPIADDTWTLLSSDFQSDTLHNFRVNGAVAGAGTNDVDLDALTTLRICGDNGGTYLPSGGYVGDVVLCGSTLSAEDLRLLENYVAHPAGVTLA